MLEGEPSCQNYSSVIKPYMEMKLWQIRHMLVSKFIRQHSIAKILDIGCSEGTLINRLSRSQYIEELIGVDIDPSVLEIAKQNVQPELMQNELRYLRKVPLTVKLYQLDILKLEDPSVLEGARGIQLVTMIQFIEHLEESQLDKLVEIVFGRIRPVRIMITTPNKEFNVYFNFKEGQVRHPGHLFEWTRSQFEQFCERVSKKYGYQTQIFGAGQHLTETVHGYCSQGCKFTSTQTPPAIQSSLTPLKPYEQIRYPFWEDQIEGLIKRELRYVMLANNFAPLSQISECFRNTKIGKKLQQNKGVNITKQYVKDRILEMEHFFIDEGEYVYYEYVEDDEVMEEQMKIDMQIREDEGEREEDKYVEPMECHKADDDDSW